MLQSREKTKQPCKNKFLSNNKIQGQTIDFKKLK